MNGLVIGVMTGTSLDAIDIALLQIKKNLPFKLVDFYSKKIPQKLKGEIKLLTPPNITNIQTLAKITNKFSREIADNLNIFLKPRSSIYLPVESVKKFGTKIGMFLLIFDNVRGCKWSG